VRIKTQPHLVDPEDPFGNDILNRRESAAILTQLIESIDEPFVLAIDAGWGRGKTTFLEQWSAMLTLDGFHILKFNAWENDFASDPLVSFIGEMRASLTSLGADSRNKEAIAETLERAKTIGGKILKRSIPAAAKMLSAGLVSLDDFTEKAMAEAVSAIAEDQIENYVADKNTLAEFRENLRAFVDLINEQEASGGKPIIFCIDELDRCRPTYSIALLERLKHLFSVPGIVFVLAIDKDQIAHSICAMYGSKFDSHGYLRRFIDLDYRLPEPHGDAYSRYLMQEYQFDEYFSRPKHGFAGAVLVEAFTMIADLFKLGLRTQDQIFSKLSIIFRTSAENERLFIHTLLFLLVVRHLNSDFYRSLEHRESTTEEAIQSIRESPAGKRLHDSQLGEQIFTQLQFGFLDEDALMGEYHNKEAAVNNARSNKSGAETIKQLERRMRAVQEMLTGNQIPVTPYLIRKIEISDRFF